MNSRTKWLIGFGLGLLALSLLLMGAHYLLFEDIHWLEKYVVFELAFLPVEVVVVTLILDRLLEGRERKERLEKMNMVIGLFFSEVGVGLLRKIAERDQKIDDVRAQLAKSADLSAPEYTKLLGTMKDFKYSPEMRPEDLAALKSALRGQRGFLVRLLENPTLLEHEEFTDSLRAVFHLTEELDYRSDFQALPASDLAHLKGDVRRAYGKLVIEWLRYMGFLKEHYPYLYSLSMRTNPFNPEASPVVRG
ncbi:MAG TPA: hypothetical protein VLT35_04285 [Methanocella sp.]|nr:hypothetical protein [Methanocella sp.]